MLFYPYFKLKGRSKAAIFARGMNFFENVSFLSEKLLKSSKVR